MGKNNKQPKPSPPAGPKVANPAPPATAAAPTPSWAWPTALTLLVLLTLAMFGDVLFQNRVVLSSRDTDMFSQYYHWRAYGFDEMRHGRLALWNPYSFSGAPFLGGFQSALLYPPNLIFLILPTPAGVNWSFALHVFLGGLFTFLWAKRRGLHPFACLLAGAVFMFCGANILRIFAGHITITCVIAWAPLLFLAIDALAERPSPGWTLIGILALAMQMLAGHPQNVFYTCVAAAIYCALCLPRIGHRTGFLIAMAAIVPGALALSAAQLFTSFQETQETLRAGGVSYDFARSYSFPPENLLTLLAPSVFGDLQAVPYWGRCNGWEMSLFLGAGTGVLAAVGAFCGGQQTRRFSVTLAVILMILALGSHTPLFNVLYHLPVFGKLRGSCKFTFLVSMFLALLAGIGFNELLKGRRVPRALWVGAVIAGLALLAAAAAVHTSLNTPDGWWHSTMMAVRNTGERGESYMWSPGFTDPLFQLEAGKLAVRSLGIGGALTVLAGALLWAARWYRPAVWLLLALALAELFVFARKSLDRFNAADLVSPVTAKFLQMHPGDYRIFDVDRPNASISLRTFGFWGYDPGNTPLRIVQLIAATQGQKPEDAMTFSTFSRVHPLFGMFRTRYNIFRQDDRLLISPETNDLPHVLLVQQYRVLTNRDNILSTLTNETFDPRREVILESEPQPRPQPSTDPGSARVVEFSPGHLTIEAEVKSPAILLVTDNYFKGWRVQALPGSSQQNYEILPANYCLRGIPLAAGTHRLRMDYLPSGFVVGRWVSCIALVIFLGLSGICCWRRFAPARKV